VERTIFAAVAAAWIGLGVCLLIRPAAMVLLNREETGGRPAPTPGEVLRTRILGIVLIASGAYGLFSLLTGVPGAEFFPA
jgi:hypothetical protein